MGNVNKVILVGNLGADPDLRQTASNRTCCRMRVATTSVYKDSSGQRQEKTEWHRVTSWGPLAESCGRYLSKGRRVFVEGRLEHRSWDGEDGKKRWSTEIVAERLEFLDSGRNGTARDGGGAESGSGYEDRFAARFGAPGPAGSGTRDPFADTADLDAA
jgi:single-strand DNA-binding protein